ncbi:uncharacterized protein LOC144149081 isoform X2 [Haemaphysalis longicornis]
MRMSLTSAVHCLGTTTIFRPLSTTRLCFSEVTLGFSPCLTSFFQEEAPAACENALQTTRKRDKKQLECTIKFVKNCLEGLTQAASLLVVKGMEEYKEAVCSVGSEKYNEHQRSVKCLNSVGTKLHACVRELHENLERILAKVPAKDVIGHTCCRYYDAHDCVSEVLNPCESVGGKTYLLGVVEQALGETLEFICGRYTRGSDQCKALPAVPQLGPKDRRIENFVELLGVIAGTIAKKH